MQGLASVSSLKILTHAYKDQGLPGRILHHVMMMNVLNFNLFGQGLVVAVERFYQWKELCCYQLTLVGAM